MYRRRTISTDEARNIAIKTLRHCARKSTIHGLRELESSRQCWLKCLWAFLIVGSAVACAFQIQQQLLQFFDGKISVKMSAQPVNQSLMRRTLIMIQSWLFVDRRLMTQYNISDQLLLCATTYYSSNVMIDVTEEQFLELQRELSRKSSEMNVSNVDEFFLRLVFDLAPAVWLNKGDPTLGPVLTPTELNGHYLGLSLNPNLIPTDAGATSVYKINIDKNVMMQMRQIYGFGRVGNVSERARFNLEIQLSSSENISVMPGQIYTVSYDIRAYRRLQDCVDRRDSYEISKEMHRLLCDIRSNISVNASSCFPFVRAPFSVKQTLDWPVCSYGFSSPQSPDRTVAAESPIHYELDETREWSRIRDADECYRNYLPYCYQYTYIPNIVISPYKISNSTSRIQVVHYKQIIAVEEVATVTWFDVFSDIGGQVGLWLGGSIVSLIQLIHLLCFGENTNRR